MSPSFLFISPFFETEMVCDQIKDNYVIWGIVLAAGSSRYVRSVGSK